MNATSWCARALRLGAVLAFILPWAGPSLAATPGCAGRPDCIANPSFSTEVVDFRNSTSGRYRVATATLRIQNLLDRPLTLGYVGDSGVVTDDQGNRYVVKPNGVRGIGVLTGSTVDTKFTLEPGESSDARFEFVWEPGRAIVGTKYDMDLTLREIDTIAGGQVKLGKERVLHFAQPRGAAGALAAGTSTPAVASPATTTTTAATTGDPCAGLARCASGGPFVAQVMSVTPVGTPQDRHHSLKLTVRFRNVGSAPIHLGYKSGTSAATDNLGNGYVYGRPGTHDTSFAGIGLITRGSADPSFRLNPGDSRDAQFSVTRFNSLGKQLGTAWVYDVVVSDLEILPSQQVRVDRDYSLHFADLTAGGIAGMSETAPNVNEAVKDLLNLFKKKEKK